MRGGARTHSIRAIDEVKAQLDDRLIVQRSAAKQPIPAREAGKVREDRHHFAVFVIGKEEVTANVRATSEVDD